MSNSQEQSLNEDVVFLPVTESCPEFLHCERERYALECLLHAGQGAFYTCVSVERLGAFLSPGEVNQLAGWTQDFHVSQLQPGEEQSAEGEDKGTNDFSECYFPAHSDTPAPCLELGWPEKDSWVGRGCSTVYTSPPAEGQPPIREIIRRHLQGASQVIAIVTDRLTDSAVIGDLHNAASRGVPVYIILNQRSFEENFTPNRLRHPNMQVRVLGGKSFCSREGKMVTGDVKGNFLLVDLESVIHGSYSLTWTDAHLHRQLITVLRGPVVESFDREFRILFAASLPVPDTSKAVRPTANVPHQRKEFSDFGRRKPLPTLEPISSPPPPPPPADPPLDWDALGVRQGGCHLPNGLLNQHEEIMVTERPLLNVTPLDKRTSTVDEFAQIRNKLWDEGRISDNAASTTNNLTDKPTSSNNTQLSPPDSLNSTYKQRVEHKIEKAYYRQISKERSADSDDRMTTTRPGENRREQDVRRDLVTVSTLQRRERVRRENLMEGEINMDRSRLGASSRDESPVVSPRKPLILRVPQSESFSSLSDIIRRLQPQQSTSAQHRMGSKTAMTELSHSMMDLSAQSTDQEERGRPVPRLQAAYFDPSRVTPGFALIKRRNDELKSAIYRNPISFLPSSRPRTSNYGLQIDWRRPQTDREGGRKDPE